MNNIHTQEKNIKELKNINFISITLFLIILIFILLIITPISTYAADPKLISTLNNAFEKIENYILKLSTPAAAIAVCTGLLMKKFSFGDEERIRTGKRLVKGSLFSYGFILCVDLVLSLIKTLLS